MSNLLELSLPAKHSYFHSLNRWEQNQSVESRFMYVSKENTNFSMEFMYLFVWRLTVRKQKFLYLPLFFADIRTMGLSMAIMYVFLIYTCEVRMLCTFGRARAMSYVHEPSWIFWQLDYYFLIPRVFIFFLFVRRKLYTVCVRYFIFQTKLLEYQRNRCTKR